MAAASVFEEKWLLEHVKSKPSSKFKARNLWLFVQRRFEEARVCVNKNEHRHQTWNTWHAAFEKKDTPGKS
jgi:hypothetical protein